MPKREFPALTEVTRSLSHPPIVAFYSVYNDMKLLPRSVASVEPYVDNLVFLDGRYAGFAGESPISTDGLRKFAYSIPKKGAYYVATGYEQHDKRNLMFRLAPPGAWILVIDGDEVLENGHLLRPTVDSLSDDFGSIHFFESGNYFTRLFRARSGVQYVDHAHLAHDGRITSICNCLGERLPDELCIHNLKHLRPRTRKLQKDVYYEEKKHRERSLVESAEHLMHPTNELPPPIPARPARRRKSEPVGD